jgi:hypothetical protein
MLAGGYTPDNIEFRFFCKCLARQKRFAELQRMFTQGCQGRLVLYHQLSNQFDVFAAIPDGSLDFCLQWFAFPEIDAYQDIVEALLDRFVGGVLVSTVLEPA